MKNGSFIIVFVTAPSEAEAEKIAAAMVTERLAACVNVIPGMTSHYTWKGRLCREKEVLLIMKARARAFPKIEKRVRSLHSYEVPEIIAFPVTMGSKPYLVWLLGSTELPQK